MFSSCIYHTAGMIASTLAGLWIDSVSDCTTLQDANMNFSQLYLLSD